VTNERPGRTPFQSHVELLQLFLAQRDRSVERMQGVLNAQQKPAWYQQDRPLLSRHFEDCFYTLAAITREQAALRGTLQQAHWACGFKPRDMPGIPNEMFDPADMIARAFALWQHTRWPGRNGRVRFAQTLFNLYLVRCMALLAMRLWDEDPGSAGSRLAQLQGVLDLLWQTSPADQPVLVRDVRWLLPVAQSPTTDALGPYFSIAEKVAGLPEKDRIEICKAAVVMAGGHLRSQLRHFTMQGTPLDDHDLLLSTRRSNALDCAMTIQALVPLLGAYGRAIDGGETRQRTELAGAILQGVSADPELFVNRLDLLAAYSMIEHLFVTIDESQRTALTAMGRRHVELVGEYTALMGRLAASLSEDCPLFRPVPGSYSPYGVMYGFSSNLLEHMTMKALQAEAETRFSLEDVFAEGESSGDRLAWVSGWRKLPHVSDEVQKLYEYPQLFAEQIFGRIERALAGATSRRETSSGQSGCLHIVPDGASMTDAAFASIPQLPAEYFLSSDSQLLGAGAAKSCDQARILADRNEGEFLVSYQTAGGWVAISKDVLTDVLGAGHRMKVTGLPIAAAGILGLLYPGLVAAC
jgi:hypothetical protein